MPPDVERRFIGRRPELNTLHTALECAVAGQPRIVLLAGEPGIGKTRTAQEIVDRAGEIGVLALWGRCPEQPGAPPYWPRLQLIRRYVAQHDEKVIGLTFGSSAPQIAALDLIAPRDGWRVGTGGWMRSRRAACSFIAASGSRRPLSRFAVIDDLHRADAVVRL
jgi:predicted ATPase